MTILHWILIVSIAASGFLTGHSFKKMYPALLCILVLTTFVVSTFLLSWQLQEIIDLLQQNIP